MPQLSASTLKLFQECPRCFWLHVNRKIERPRGPFPSLPSGIDRVLKAYYDTYRLGGTLPPLIAGRLEGKLATHPLTLGFNDAATGARLWGKLDDCVVLPDERLAPLDHKTRASSPENIGYTEKYYRFQMDVYTLLLERNGFRTSRTAYVVYYFPMEGVLHEGFPFEVTVHKIATRPEEAYQVFAKACRCLAGSLPEAERLCGFCQWAEALPPHQGATVYGGGHSFAPGSSTPRAHSASFDAAAAALPRPHRGKIKRPLPNRSNRPHPSRPSTSQQATIPNDLFS